MGAKIENISRTTNIHYFLKKINEHPSKYRKYLLYYKYWQSGRAGYIYNLERNQKGLKKAVGEGVEPSRGS